MATVMATMMTAVMTAVMTTVMTTVMMVAAMVVVTMPYNDMAESLKVVMVTTMMMMLHLDYLVLRGNRSRRQWRCDACRDTDGQSDGREDGGQH